MSYLLAFALLLSCCSLLSRNTIQIFLKLPLLLFVPPPVKTPRRSLFAIINIQHSLFIINQYILDEEITVPVCINLHTPLLFGFRVVLLGEWIVTFSPPHNDHASLQDPQWLSHCLRSILAHYWPRTGSRSHLVELDVSSVGCDVMRGVLAFLDPLHLGPIAVLVGGRLLERELNNVEVVVLYTPHSPHSTPSIYISEQLCSAPGRSQETFR